MKDISSGIYKITNTVNGKFYIGSAVKLNRRWNVHKSQLRNGKHHSILLQRSWNKYGEDSFAFEVLEAVPPDKLMEVEQKYIDCLQPCNPKVGYNVSEKATCVCLRGEKHPCFGKAVSEERKEKIRKALNGHGVSAETRAKISVSCKGVCAGEKHPMYGLPVSQERRKAQSGKMMGRYAGENNPAAKAVSQFTQNGCFVRWFKTLKQAAESVDGDNSNITNCCKGRYKTAYGYIWRYIRDGETR